MYYNNINMVKDKDQYIRKQTLIEFLKFYPYF